MPVVRSFNKARKFVSLYGDCNSGTALNEPVKSTHMVITV